MLQNTTLKMQSSIASGLRGLAFLLRETADASEPSIGAYITAQVQTT